MSAVHVMIAGGHGKIALRLAALLAGRGAGVRRHLLVSSAEADADPVPGTDEAWAAYRRAKDDLREAATLVVL